MGFRSASDGSEVAQETAPQHSVAYRHTAARLLPSSRTRLELPAWLCRVRAVTRRRPFPPGHGYWITDVPSFGIQKVSFPGACTNGEEAVCTDGIRRAIPIGTAGVVVSFSESHVEPLASSGPVIPARMLSSSIRLRETVTSVWRRLASVILPSTRDQWTCVC